jgi:cholesterol transport system auxiliary component
MKRRTPVLVWTLAALASGGCALRPAPRAPVAYHDLGEWSGAPAGPPIDALIIVPDPAGPLWVDSDEMHYRLAYDDPSRVRRFANSQWVVSPLQMIGARLRAALAARVVRGGALADIGVPGDYWLRSTVEEFGQVFDDSVKSRGVLRMRVALVRARGHALVEQRGFAAEVPAPTPDARGGVAALTQALDQCVAAVSAWVAETVAGAPAGASGAQ